MGRNPDRQNRKELIILALLLLLGAAARFFYLSRMDLPPYDPWRHLLLVKNLRQNMGFTLFDGQPYFWYSPVWYLLCAVLPSWLELHWTASLFSLLSVPPFYLLIRKSWGIQPASAAACGAVLMAAFGPLIGYTCHSGAEAFSFFLMLAALLLCSATSRILPAILSGVLFGASLIVRMNFAFNLLLYLGCLKRRKQGLAVLAGLAIPLALTWWRNHQIIGTYPYVFTWDGLATRSSDFNWLSTLVVQMHPAVHEGLRRLHQNLIPNPEWFGAWDLLLFMVCSIGFLLASKRFDLILTGVLTLGYFLLLDTSLSSHFFRLYLGLFPVFFMAVSIVVGRFCRSKPRLGSLVALAVAGWILLTGVRHFACPPVNSLEEVTPPPELLAEEAYMVNSAFYHPECLIYRFPEKKFIGMPLDPDQFEDFQRHYPAYRSVLLHPLSIQNKLARYLKGHGYQTAASAENRFGRRYTVLKRLGEE